MVFRRTLALILAVGSFGAVAAAPALTLRSITAVSCGQPTRTLYERHINVSGTIESQNIKEIYLETPVIASSVSVAVGDRVKKGQVLAEIDSSLTKSVLEQSVPSAALAAGIQIGTQDISELAGLYSALSSGLGVGSENPLEALAQVYGGMGSVEKPEMNSYLYIPETVSAPMDGVITELSLKSDVLSRTARPLITISDDSSFAAMVTVGESYISDIKVGDRAIITGTGFASREYSGHISKIHPVARKAAGGTSQETVVDVEIEIDNPDEWLKAGFTARAELITETSRSMITVPYEAVRQDESNVEYVYIAAGSTAVRRDIETGVELMEGVEVVKGLAGDELIIKNAANIKTDGEYISLHGGGDDAG